MTPHGGFADGSFDDMLARAAEAHGFPERLWPRDAEERVVAWRCLEELHTRLRATTSLIGLAARMGF
ncbi:MAG TPA: hypothetical protein PLA97_08855 [Rubrivivax sp.]|nr:hypothetical protein [Rubrivivax sp.]